MFMQKTLKIKLKSEEASSKWDKLIALRDDVNKALEEARKNKVNGLIYVNAIDWQNTNLKINQDFVFEMKFGTDKISTLI